MASQERGAAPMSAAAEPLLAGGAAQGSNTTLPRAPTSLWLGGSYPRSESAAPPPAWFPRQPTQFPTPVLAEAAGNETESPSQPQELDRESTSLRIFPAMNRQDGEEPDYWGLKAKAWQNKIPKWAVNKKVFELAMHLRLEEVHEPMPLQCAVGPAVPLAFVASKIAWLVFFTVPWPAYMFSHCVSADELDEAHGGFQVAKLRAPAAFWVLLSPAILILLLIEWLCLRYYLIPQVQATGGFKLFGYPVGFKIWLPVAFIMSALSHADLITNGVFLATTWKTNSCSSGRLDQVWKSVMQQGVLWDYMPELSPLADLRFESWVTALWMMMPLQAIYGVLGAMPLHKFYHYILKHPWRGRSIYLWLEKRNGWWPHGITQHVRREGKGKPYMTLEDLIAWNARAPNPNPVAQVHEWWNGMEFPGFEQYLHESANYTSLDFKEVKDFVKGGDGFGTVYQTFLDDSCFSYGDHGTALLSLADSTRMSTITSAKVEYAKQKLEFYLKRKKHGPAFGVTKRVLQSAVHKVLLAGVLQSGFQVNLQISLLGMTNYLAGGMNWQMLFSVTVGVCVMVRNFVEVWQLWAWVKSVLDIPANEGGIRDNTFRETLNYKFLALTVFVGLYAFLAFCAMAKFVAIFYCTDSMLDANGCADIQLY